MPIYSLSKADRARILNVSVEHLDQAQALIAMSYNEHLDAKKRNEQLCASGTPDEQTPALPPILSWHDACRIVEPCTDHGKYHFLIDNGEGDHGTHVTMAFSKNVARILEADLGIKPQFVHDVHHRPQDHQ